MENTLLPTSPSQAMSTHRAAPISFPMTYSQTPAYSARQLTWGWCVLRCARLLPSFRSYWLCLLTEGWPVWL